VAAAPRELVVIARSAETRAAGRRGRAAAAAPAGLESVGRLLEAEGAALTPLFGLSGERLRLAAAAAPAVGGVPAPDLSIYYRVEAPEERLDGLAERLRSEPAVAAAYVKPPAELPARLNDMAPAAVEAPPATADFTARQGYLDAAPGGIDARAAWARAGGGGAGVRIVDVEGEWRFSHEDLLQNQGGLIGGSAPGNRNWRNHGTAVVGELGGDRNGFGVTGICPDADVRAVSIFGPGSAGAIRLAADALGPGDILLIELHRAGPRFNYEPRLDQLGYIAVEWWPDDFDAIRYAVSRGVIVVEAAGNGAESLDDHLYSVRPADFPADWTNPFNRANRDSGAIVVGAGAPPPGTHGSNHGPDRSRLDFSNHGALVDAQGWGREVTTCGYGDLQGGRNEDLWYTDFFGGTSSASPIVVGALGCVQGALRAGNRPILTPAAARDLLRTTGSPQQDAPGRPASQRIGSRPNLQEMIARLLPPLTMSVPLHRYWNPVTTDHFYTTDFSELGSGRGNFRYEGIECYVLPKRRRGTVPLHRYWSRLYKDHFYTTDFSELGTGRDSYVYEKVQCHVYPSPQPGTVALHRYWKPTVKDHFYTTDFSELGNGRFGYRYQGVQCHVFAEQLGVPAAEGLEEATTEPEPGTLRAARMAGPIEPAEEAPLGLQMEGPLEGAEASLVVPETFAAAAEGGEEEEEGVSETFRIEKREGVREVVISIKF
jgi:hypothetical protein